MSVESIHSQGTLLASMRVATASAHIQVERRVDITVPWSHARYLSFLRATLAVVGPLEPSLRHHLGAQRFPLLANASCRLRADILALGASVDARAEARAPRIDTEADAFGAAYVLLGSLLGGRLIARTLEQQLMPGAIHFNYLRPPGDLGATWRHFTNELNTWSVAAAIHAREATVQTALRVFHAFDASFANEGFA